MKIENAVKVRRLLRLLEDARMSKSNLQSDEKKLWLAYERYSLSFIDGSAGLSCKTNQMQDELIRKHVLPVILKMIEDRENEIIEELETL